MIMLYILPSMVYGINYMCGTNICPGQTRCRSPQSDRRGLALSPRSCLMFCNALCAKTSESAILNVFGWNGLREGGRGGYMCVYMWVSVCMCGCVNVCVGTCVYVWVRVHMCWYVCVCVLLIYDHLCEWRLSVGCLF